MNLPFFASIVSFNGVPVNGARQEFIGYRDFARVAEAAAHRHLQDACRGVTHLGCVVGVRVQSLWTCATFDVSMLVSAKATQCVFPPPSAIGGARE